MKLVTALLIIFSAVSCAAETDWESATLSSAGIDSGRIERLLEDAERGTFPNIHAVIVARSGKLVLEQYFNGFNEESRQFTASVSKSVGSILFGIALDRGLIPGVHGRDVDVPLEELLPEHTKILSEPDKRGLQLRHVLSMSAGLTWDEQSHPYDDPRNDWYRASRTDDPVGFTLARPAAAEAGTVFNYNGGLSIIVSYLIESGSGMNAGAFAQEYLFEPLGIADYQWERLPCGLTDTDGGLYMRPRDMAKLGQLYLNGGLWRGTRIVSREWVNESVREHMVNEQSPNYGFQWWCGDFHYGDRSTFMFLASGHGGQKIYVVPEFDLVVVLTHEVFNNPMGEIHNNAILTRYILPAVDTRDVEDLPQWDAATRSRYVGKYASENQSFAIVERDGGLLGQSPGQPSLEITPLSWNRFRGTTMGLIDVELLFDLAEDGAVRGVRTTYAFTERYYRKVGSP